MKFLIRFVIFVAAVILLLVAVKYLTLDRWANARMTPSMREEYQRLKDVKINVSMSEMRAMPFSETTRNAVKNLNDQWKLHEQKALSMAKDYTEAIKKYPEETTPILSLFHPMSEMTPLLDAIEQLVKCPDYDIEAMGGKPGITYGIPTPDFHKIQTCVKLLSLRSIEAAEQGDYNRAFDLAETIFRMSKTSRYSGLISQIAAISTQSIGARTWYWGVDVCNDKDLLERTLSCQNELFPTAPLLQENPSPMAIDALGYIREAGRAGIAIENPDGKTGIELLQMSGWVQAEYIEKVQAPRLPLGHQRKEALETAQMHRNMSALMGGRRRGGQGFIAMATGFFLRPLMTSIMMPNSQEILIRAKISMAYLDLVRCFSADKVFQFDRGRAPGELKELVPEYLPKVPKDPFSPKEETYSFDPSVGYYSIGPDQVDQKGAFRYDPTNGANSTGDIFFPRK